MRYFFLLSCVVVFIEALKAPATCATEDLGKRFCSDCLGVVRCDVKDEAPNQVNRCAFGKVCGAIAGTVDCISNRTGTPCDCSRPICDPYSDTASLAVCTAAGVIANYPCNVDPNTACNDGRCREPGTFVTVAPPPTTETVNEACEGGTYPKGVFFPRPNTCRRGVFCVMDNRGIDAGLQCSEIEYFDGTTVSCKSLPVQNCAGDAHGVYPDKTDCTQYVICVSGTLAVTNKCYAEAPNYDTVSMSCKEVTEAQCDPTTNCNFGAA